MSAKIKYTDEPIGKIKIVSDFLPTPEELAFREEGVKVTLALSKRSVDFFKSEAAKHHTQYQRMIRRLLDSYVETHEEAGLAKRSRRTKAWGRLYSYAQGAPLRFVH
jgi:hypothetical protein